MSETAHQDQTPEVIAKEIVIAMIPKYLLTLDELCEAYDRIHKQVIQSTRNNYK